MHVWRIPVKPSCSSNRHKIIPDTVRSGKSLLLKKAGHFIVAFLVQTASGSAAYQNRTDSRTLEVFDVAITPMLHPGYFLAFLGFFFSFFGASLLFPILYIRTVVRICIKPNRGFLHIACKFRSISGKHSVCPNRDPLDNK